MKHTSHVLFPFVKTCQNPNPGHALPRDIYSYINMHNIYIHRQVWAGIT